MGGRAAVPRPRVGLRAPPAHEAADARRSRSTTRPSASPRGSSRNGGVERHRGRARRPRPLPALHARRAAHHGDALLGHAHHRAVDADVLRDVRSGLDDPQPHRIEVPTGLSLFRDHAPPASWLSRSTTCVTTRSRTDGGHFPALEIPRRAGPASCVTSSGRSGPPSRDHARPEVRWAAGVRGTRTCEVNRNRVLVGIVVVLTVVAATTSGWSRLDEPGDATRRASTRTTRAAPAAPATPSASTVPTTPPDPRRPSRSASSTSPSSIRHRGVAARGATPAAAERTLPLTIQYPAASGAASPCRRSRRAGATRTGPLVLFAHGLALRGPTYPRFLHDLAAAGFVVADPEFPLSSGALPGPARSDPVDQAADLAFVADQLLDPPAPRAAAHGDVPRPLVVIGHSDGGITAAGFAANSCYADPASGP